MKKVHRVTYCHNATLGKRDFYRILASAMDLHPKASAAALFHAITFHVAELGAQRIHPVIVLDEAHMLRQDMLDHLHILLNYDWDRLPLLSVVLIGLPELATRLALRSNRSLQSRLHVRVAIEPCSPQETAEYVRHRTTIAGAAHTLFASEAIVLLHEASLGIHRDIDRLATRALQFAAAADREIAERGDVLAAIKQEFPANGANS